MSWILVLSLLSNSGGHYEQSFRTEKECLESLNVFIKKNLNNSDIKYVGCVSSEYSFGE